ncbi:hypothetical protein F5X71_28480 [Nocardia brasiliensis]|uniref:Uncharacterized protein n=1 Tax=Nocardia brasiliensis TaxID=37326 RepID=A0A6G9Y3G5_NOCBR|nr:hypothetical protein F5X71_28480 [Nocardia brasiliensis]
MAGPRRQASALPKISDLEPSQVTCRFCCGAADFAQGGFISEAERMAELLAHVVTRAVEPRVTQVEHVLHQLIERGAVRADIDTRTIATMVFGAFLRGDAAARQPARTAHHHPLARPHHPLLTAPQCASSTHRVRGDSVRTLSVLPSRHVVVPGLDFEPRRRKQARCLGPPTSVRTPARSRPTTHSLAAYR